MKNTGNAQPEKKRMQLHGSGIGMLAACGIQFQFRYIDGIKRSPNKGLIAGSATHKSVECDLQNKIENFELLPQGDIKDIAASTVRDIVDTDGITLIDDDEKSKGKAAVVGEAVDKAVILATVHHVDVAPLISPVKVSRKFSINMDNFLRARAKRLYAEAEKLDDKFNRKVRESQARALNAIAARGLDYSGEQDIVEELPPTGEVDNTDYASQRRSQTLHIRDTKTSSKSPVATVADESDQLSGYALASSVLDGKIPDKMMLDYLVETKSGKTKNVTLTTTRTDEDMEVFLNRFANAVHALHTGVFVPAKPDDWRCSAKWCGYFSMCSYAARPKSALVNIDLE